MMPTYEQWLAWRAGATFDDWRGRYEAERRREKESAAQRAVEAAMADTIQDHPVFMKLLWDEPYCRKIERLWRERWHRGWTDEELVAFAIEHEKKSSATAIELR